MALPGLWARVSVPFELLFVPSMPHFVHQVSRACARALPPLEKFFVKVAELAGRPDEEVITDLRGGGRMKLNLREYFGLHIYIRGHHQPYVLDHFREFLKPGMTMFDIGAHFGLFTLTAANLVGPTGRIHAFEPGETQLNYLRANVALNQYEDRVRVNAVALGDTPGQIGYEPGPEENLGASHVSTKPGGRIVPVIRLDDYCASNGIERIDAVKMDVEGFELNVLRGFHRTLSKYPPKLIAYECDPESCAVHGLEAAKVHEFFLDLGYTITTARGGAPVTREDKQHSRTRHDFVARHPTS